MLYVVNNLASPDFSALTPSVEINKCRVSKLSYSDRDEFDSSA